MASSSDPPAQPDTSQIAVEPDLRADEFDGDSAYDSEINSYTTSLASGIEDYKFEHGRRYHAYKEGSYLYPNDEKEKDRLDVAHQMVLAALGGQLYNAPVKNPKRALDIGTGTGIWAMEFGDKWPNADVLGNDLSPIQPRWVPPNVRFEVDDVEAEWTYAQKFDFIHCATMSACIRDWPKLVRQVKEFTKPGHYAEFTDYDLNYDSPDRTLPKDGFLFKTNQQFLEMMRGLGLEPNPGLYLEGWLKEAGFEDIKVKKIPLPVGTWPADKRLKEVGAWNLVQATEGLEGFLTALYSRQQGYSKQEIDVMCAKLSKEMKDPKLHGMYWLYNVIGRAPAAKSRAEDDQ